MINGILEYIRHTEENFSELEVIVVENIQNKAQEEMFFNFLKSVLINREQFKYCNIYAISIPKGEMREEKQKSRNSCKNIFQVL